MGSAQVDVGVSDDKDKVILQINNITYINIKKCFPQKTVFNIPKMMNVSSDYIYDDAILNRPCLSERNEKSKTAKNGPTPLGSRTDCSATDGRSDMR